MKLIFSEKPLKTVLQYWKTR